MGLHEAIELLTNLIAMLYKVFQMMFSIASILVEAPRDDLSESEVMDGGNEEGL